MTKHESDKINDLMTGLTDREYVLLALASLDQAGVSLHIQKRVQKLVEEDLLPPG